MKPSTLRASLVASLLGVALVARAGVLTFDELSASQINGQRFEIFTQGFRIEQGDDDYFATTTPGEGPAYNYTGSNTLYDANRGDHLVQIFRADGGTFSARSIDVANLFTDPGSQGATVDLGGVTAAGKVFGASFTLPKGDDALHTVSLTGFDDVVSVSFRQGSPGYPDPVEFQVDNLAFALPVPEPAPVAALGLCAVGLLRRRKRA